jgi:hypothetical protein
MLGYQTVWLFAVIFSLASGVAVLGLGAYLLRRVVEDPSNGTDWRALTGRGLKLMPGIALITFGFVLLVMMVHHITTLTLPTP